MIDTIEKFLGTKHDLTTTIFLDNGSVSCLILRHRRCSPINHHPRYSRTLLSEPEAMRKPSIIYGLVWFHFSETHVFEKELNTLATFELVLPNCHIGPQTHKIKIWHTKLVNKLCHLGPYPLTWRTYHEYMQKKSFKFSIFYLPILRI